MTAVQKSAQAPKKRSAKQTKKQVDLELRRSVVLELRMAGFTYREIAAHMVKEYAKQPEYDVTASYNHTNAARDVEHCLKEIAEQNRDKTEEMRALEDERLTRLYAGHSDKAESGDTFSANVCLGVIDRRARLFGLNAPVKTEVTGKDGGAIQTEDVNLSDTERLKRLMALADTARARAGGSGSAGAGGDEDR